MLFWFKTSPMKKLSIILVVLLPLVVFAQEPEYNLSSYLDEGIKAPNTHHLGDAWLNFLLKADADFDQNITQATFSANSRASCFDPPHYPPRACQSRPALPIAIGTHYGL